jgi:DNA helicase-2/ATP-dependent DNA helicase PcrA
MRATLAYSSTPAAESLLEFVQDALLATDEGGQEGGGNDDQGASVKLMTIHSSKGLEFDRVFVCGCEEGFLPLGAFFDEEDAIEEERRLFYVAITRAKVLLYLVVRQMVVNHAYMNTKKNYVRSNSPTPISSNV